MSGRVGRLLGELQRRRVFRVAVVYGAVAFVVAQVADIAFPALQLPDWTVTLVVVLAILGFPIALVLAWAFEITPDGMRRQEPRATGGQSPEYEAEHGPGHGPAAGRRANRAAWFVLGLLVAFSVGWYGVSRLNLDAPGTDELDASLVAVMPFRVAGADPSLGYLREGMVDLLAAKLTGDGGPRAVDPRTLMSAWRRAVPGEHEDLEPAAAATLGRGLGAASVLLGEVVGTPGRLILTASTVSSRTGERSAPVSVDGPPDSLPALVDRLAGAMLLRDAGEAEHRLASLTSTSLPALRAYLQGRADYRRGHFEEALAHYNAALRHDSTFALAAMGAERSLGWAVGPAEERRAVLDLAWRHRDRLSARDRGFLEAVAGPSYPEPRSVRERLVDWERVVRQRPDDAEAWYEMGDILFHYGRLFGDDAFDRAFDAFQHAHELDPSFGVVRIHLVDAAEARGDSATVARVAEHHLAEDSTSMYAVGMRAMLARVNGQEAEVQAHLAEMSRLIQQTEGVGQLPVHLTVFPVDDLPRTWHEPMLALADQAARVAATRGRTSEDRILLAELRRRYAYNRGRTTEALRATRDLADASGDPLLEARLTVLDALHWSGDPQRARAGASRLADALRAAGDAQAMSADRSGRDALCALGQWRLAQNEAGGAEAGGDEAGGVATVADLVAALRAPSTADGSRGPGSAGDSLCADLLAAWAAHQDGRPDAAEKIRRLDRFLADGGGPSTGIREQSNLVVARLLEERGDLAGAYQAARRQIFLPGGEFYASSAVREQGRLAARLGDREAALSAYQAYLLFHSDPDPGPAAEQAAAVRDELARLVRER